MLNFNIFLIIFVLFIIFILFQIYFYYKRYHANQNQINKIENFKNTLLNIESEKDYLLDDTSVERLLEDYNNLKNNE